MSTSWRLYNTPPALVYGFHGCDASVAERVLSGHEALRPSENQYDWLGHGIYFWENDPHRAMEYAKAVAARSTKASKAIIQTPAVIGAVIDLAHCLNLLSSKYLDELAGAHAIAMADQAVASIKNGPSFGARFLDCAVIQTLHQYREQRELLPYDSVRSVFWEGTPVYPGAGINNKNHIQICVRNPAVCIKGYFRPIPD